MSAETTKLLEELKLEINKISEKTEPLSPDELTSLFLNELIQEEG